MYGLSWDKACGEEAGSKRMQPFLSSAATAQISAEQNRERLQRKKKKKRIKAAL